MIQVNSSNLWKIVEYWQLLFTKTNSKSDLPKCLDRLKISELHENSWFISKISGHLFSMDSKCFIPAGSLISLGNFFFLKICRWNSINLWKIVSAGWRDNKNVETGEESGPLKIKIKDVVKSQHSYCKNSSYKHTKACDRFVDKRMEIFDKLWM